MAVASALIVGVACPWRRATRRLRRHATTFIRATPSA